MAGSNLSPEVSRGPMLCDCFVVEDDQSTRDVVLHALDKLGLVNRAFAEAPAVVEALDFVVPKVVFLDVFLGGSDAIEVIRALAERAFRGVVQLVSGQRPSLVADVRKVGERYGLRMRAPIQKPFPLDAIRLVITEEGVLRETSTVKGDLGEALRNGWVEFFYQPKINLRTRVIIGAEALARIRHPEDGILAASSFIPGAKQVELRELSLLGVATALRDWPSFKAAGLNLKLAINLSCSDLLQLPIAQILRSHLPATDEFPGLIFELTETEQLSDYRRAHEVATQLSIYGCRLSIDDFGTGYSSIERLVDLPVEEVKLDRRFVRDCNRDLRNAKICANVIRMAHDLGLQVCGEGVENTAEAKTLRELGCNSGQGFLFLRPVSKDDLIETVQTRPKIEVVQSLGTPIRAKEDGRALTVSSKERGDR